MTYFAIRNPAVIAPPNVGNMFTGFFLSTNDLGGAAFHGPLRFRWVLNLRPTI